MFNVFSFEAKASTGKQTVLSSYTVNGRCILIFQERRLFFFCCDGKNGKLQGPDGFFWFADRMRDRSKWVEWGSFLAFLFDLW